MSRFLSASSIERDLHWYGIKLQNHHCSFFASLFENGTGNKTPFFGIGHGAPLSLDQNHWQSKQFYPV
jgi:hypothetical protein